MCDYMSSKAGPPGFCKFHIRHTKLYQTWNTFSTEWSRPSVEIWQSSIWYAGWLGWWDDHLTKKILMFQVLFFYNVLKNSLQISPQFINFLLFNNFPKNKEFWVQPTVLLSIHQIRFGPSDWSMRQPTQQPSLSYQRLSDFMYTVKSLKVGFFRI